MKLLRLAPCLALLVFALASCGGAPPLEESKQGSALYTPDGFWYGTNKNVSGQYSCQGDQWWAVAAMDQGFSVGQGTSQWSTNVKFFTTSDNGQPHLAIDCSYSVGGPFHMVKGSGLLYNDSARSGCTIYSHRRNDPGGWFYVGGATVPIYGLQYFPSPDRWVIDIQPAANVVGQPGFCGPDIVTTLYPS